MTVEFQSSRTFKANKSHRFMGVEVEIAYVNQNKYSTLESVAAKWKGIVGRDGSVGGKKKFKYSTPTNLELKTAPANGDLFIKQMLEYGKAFKETGCMTNDTCGLHVHVDARDLDDDALDRVLILWSKVEKSMFDLVSPRRAASNWCRPWGFLSSMDDIRAKLPVRQNYDYNTGRNVPVTLTDPKKLLTNLKSNSIYPNRYSALNLCALAAHSTLENRMHHGTTNVDNIINWALINASIIDFAKENPMGRIEEMKEGWETLMDVINNETVKGWAVARKSYWEEFVRTAPERAKAKADAKEARRAARRAQQAARVRPAARS